MTPDRTVSFALKWRVNLALRDAHLPAASKLIMLVLSDMAHHETGKVRQEHSPSVAELARICSLSESTVKRHLPMLEKIGWLARSKPDRIAQARHIARTYQIKLPAEYARSDAPAGPQQTPAEDRGSTQDPAGGAHRTPAGVQDEPPCSNNHHHQKQLSPPASPLTERPDVLRVCTHLATQIAADRRTPFPRVTPDWIGAAAALLDEDQAPELEILRLISWSQKHVFWRGVIMDMPAFRKHYAKMLRQAGPSLPTESLADRAIADLPVVDPGDVRNVADAAVFHEARTALRKRNGFAWVARNTLKPNGISSPLPAAV